jgi:hypothetical protein
MLRHVRDDAPPPERREQPQDRLAHHRDSAIALVAAAGDDQQLAGAARLPLAQPALGARDRFTRGGQRVPQVQCASRSESRLVERLVERMKPGRAVALHPRVT